MYRTVSYEELLKLKSTFFESLSAIIKKNRCPSFKDYLKVVASQGDCIYHIAKQEVIWRTIKQWANVSLFDERERLELQLNPGTISKINSLLADAGKLKAQKRSSISIEQTLTQAFESGSLSAIASKSYIVYDIETSYVNDDVLSAEFYLGYAYVVQEWKASYKYIDTSNLAKFVEYLLDFDGYVIGYNSLAFDNPICVYQALQLTDSYTLERYHHDLALLNAKSLDLFQFVRWLTWRRIGLNKLSRALIGLGKTLESGAQAQGLRESYQAGDSQALATLKTYCKNDVKMTYLTLRYLLHFQSISRENEEKKFDLDAFVVGAQQENTEKSHDLVGPDTSSIFAS